MSRRPTSREAFALAVLVALAMPALAHADAYIIITDTTFAPVSVTVKRGDVVTWDNQDTKAHTVTSDDGTTMKSGLLEPGASFATLFKSAGTFRYRSTAAGDSMRGTVIVKPGALPTATGPKPPTGTVPQGFKPGQGTTGTTQTADAEASSTDWDTIGLVVGIAAVAAAAVVLVALLRHRRARTG